MASRISCVIVSFACLCCLTGISATTTSPVATATATSSNNRDSSTAKSAWTSSTTRTPVSSNDTGKTRDIDHAGLHIAYTMVNFFLERIIQSRQLNFMEEKGVNFTNLTSIEHSFRDKWQDWVLYLIGFAVCVALGLVLLLVMLIVSPCVPCCRCCGNCGGKVDHSNHKGRGCRSCCCGFTLLLLTLVVAFGAGTMIHASLRYTDRLSGENNIFVSLGNNINQLNQYGLNTIHEVSDNTIIPINVTSEEILRMLRNLPNSTIDRIDNETGLSQNVEPLLEFTGSFKDLQINLTTLQNISDTLRDTYDEFRPKLDALTGNVTDVLIGCSEPDCEILKNLTTSLPQSVNFSTVDVRLQIDAVGEAISANISENLEYGYLEFINLTNEVNSRIEPQIANIRNTINNIQTRLSDNINRVEREWNKIRLNNVSKTLKDLPNNSGVKLGFGILFGASVGIASALGFTALLLLCGLCLGASCGQPKEGKDQCCTRAAGAHFILAGLGFVFILFIFYLIITIPLFVAGGITHTEACRHMVRLMDGETTPGMNVINKLATSQLKQANVSLNFVNVTNQCKNNTAFYTAFRLEQNGLNLTELLDVDKMGLKNATDSIKSVNIVLPKVTVLDNETKTALDSVQNSLAEMDVGHYAEVMSRNWTSDSLGDYANRLETANITNATVKGYLLALANASRDLGQSLHETRYITLRQQALGIIQGLNESIKSLAGNNWTDEVMAANSYVNTNGSMIVRGLVNETADGAYGTIKNTAEDIRERLTNDVGRCGQVHTILSDATDMACRQLLYPVNAYWFALAWSVIILLPVIIIAFKVVTLFRKRVQEDEADILLPAQPYQSFVPPKVVHEMPPFDNPAYQGGGETSYIPRPSIKGPQVLPSEPPPKYYKGTQGPPYYTR